nr:MAG TPA: hypothetical protein [Caudoviricetes sp.]
MRCLNGGQLHGPYHRRGGKPRLLMTEYNHIIIPLPVLGAGYHRHPEQ